MRREKNYPQRQESVWEDQSTAVRKLLERFLHYITRLHRKVEEQPNKRSKKGGDKSADVRQLGCVLQDTKPSESSARHKSLGTYSTSTIHKNCAASVKLPYQRNPYALKFEDRSQEVSERQGRCARGDAWRLAQNIFISSKKRKRATFYSPSDEWVLLAGGKRVCGGLWSKHAYGQQERS